MYITKENYPLKSKCNWICHHCVPSIVLDSAANGYAEPANFVIQEQLINTFESMGPKFFFEI